MSEWKPIESAPKDGTPILVAVWKPVENEALGWPMTDTNRRVTIAAWVEMDFGTANGWRAIESSLDSSYGGDTHSFEYLSPVRVEPIGWMPLPEPPKE